MHQYRHQQACNPGCHLCLQVGVGLTAPKADAMRSVVEFGYSLPTDDESLPSMVSPAAKYAIPCTVCTQQQPFRV
jgi:hypothetical protein